MSAITDITVKAVTVLTGQVKGVSKENPRKPNQRAPKVGAEKASSSNSKNQKSNTKTTKKDPGVVVTVPQGANFEITIKSKGPQQKKVESGTRNQKGKGCASNCKNAPQVKSNKK